MGGLSQITMWLGKADRSTPLSAFL